MVKLCPLIVNKICNYIKSEFDLMINSDVEHIKKTDIKLYNLKLIDAQGYPYSMDMKDENENLEDIIHMYVKQILNQSEYARFIQNGIKRERKILLNGVHLIDYYFFKNDGTHLSVFLDAIKKPEKLYPWNKTHPTKPKYNRLMFINCTDDHTTSTITYDCDIKYIDYDIQKINLIVQLLIDKNNAKLYIS